MYIYVLFERNRTKTELEPMIYFTHKILYIEYNIFCVNFQISCKIHNLSKSPLRLIYKKIIYKINIQKKRKGKNIVCPRSCVEWRLLHVGFDQLSSSNCYLVNFIIAAGRCGGGRGRCRAPGCTSVFTFPGERRRRVGVV